MAEWLMALVLKTSERESVPWVRILPLPPIKGKLTDQGVRYAWKALRRGNSMVIVLPTFRQNMGQDMSIHKYRLATV